MKGGAKGEQETGQMDGRQRNGRKGAEEQVGKEKEQAEGTAAQVGRRAGAGRKVQRRR